MKKGDAVFCKCAYPATGHIVRIAKDKTWADVEWCAGLKCVYISRIKTSLIDLLMPVLNEKYNQSFQVDKQESE